MRVYDRDPLIPAAKTSNHSFPTATDENASQKTGADCSIPFNAERLARLKFAQVPLDRGAHQLPMIYDRSQIQYTLDNCAHWLFSFSIFPVYGTVPHCFAFDDWLRTLQSTTTAWSLNRPASHYQRHRWWRCASRGIGFPHVVSGVLSPNNGPSAAVPNELVLLACSF